MDKFEEMSAKMAKMKPEKMNSMMRDLDGSCFCPKCPSYNVCAKEKNDRLFCLKGKSSCGMSRLGCICPDCPVTDRMGLKNTYYCMKGSEKNMRRI